MGTVRGVSGALRMSVTAAMLAVLVGLFAVAAMVGMPASAWAERIYRCVDVDGVIRIEQGVLPAWCASQYAPVDPGRPGTSRELDGTQRWLERQLAAELESEERCRAGHERINEIKDDGLDLIDEISDSRMRGRVSRADQRAAKRIVQAADAAHAGLNRCAAEARNRASELRAALTDPVKIKAAVPEWRADQLRIEREDAARRRATVRALEERERAAEAKKRADEEGEAEAQRRARAQREAEEGRARERAQAVRRDLGAILARIAATSRTVIDESQKAQPELAQVERDVDILQRRYGSALRAPEYREPVALLVEGVLALRAARAALEREAQLAIESARLAAHLQAMRKGMGSGVKSLMDQANLDRVTREAESARTEHQEALRTLAERRGALVRVAEHSMQQSASLH